MLVLYLCSWDVQSCSNDEIALSKNTNLNVDKKNAHLLYCRITSIIKTIFILEHSVQSLH